MAGRVFITHLLPLNFSDIQKSDNWLEYVFKGYFREFMTRIGENVSIGANAVVIKDVAENSTVVGIPVIVVKINYWFVEQYFCKNK